MRAASVQTSTATVVPRGSRRLLSLAGDERLVEQIRRGNEAAFEVAFERYGPAILGFCRHMLRSPEEAEDAVQHTFAAAHRYLVRESEREVTLKPWLFTIARNRCLSMLRARRELPVEDAQLPTAGLAEQVEQRAELRQLLTDLGLQLVVTEPRIEEIAQDVHLACVPRRAFAERVKQRRDRGTRGGRLARAVAAMSPAASRGPS